MVMRSYTLVLHLFINFVPGWFPIPDVSMHVRNLYKTLAFYACVVVAVAVALEFYPIYSINDRDSLSFSAQRVSDDIRVISKEPHSIQHTKERKVLREFLFHRLQQMGGSTQVIEYDTIPSKLGGSFSYANIFSEFNPPDSISAYVLLVAHYDSRYRQIVGKDTVFSYGAADDGYGVGVILEIVGQALRYKDEWRQGIRVLFTDAEEHDLNGMRSAWSDNPEIFEGVNLVVNVEARGVKGPALLFETSPGNEKVMELYSVAERASGLSLTSFVYGFLPSDTDFSVVKDTLPGMNFSVIDNLKLYHTNLDNYSNISLKSVQHYGDQLEPVMREYLVNVDYGSPDAFCSGSDKVFFTLPVLGLFTFSKAGFVLINLAIFALFFFVLYIYVKYKMISVKGVLRSFRHLLMFAFGAAAVGFAIAYGFAKYYGLEFSMVDLRYIQYDVNILLVLVFVLVVWLLVFVRLQERKFRYYVWEMLLGSNLFVSILALILFVVAGDNYFVALPLATSSIAMFFSVARNFKWLYLISCALTVLVAVHFLYLLYVAITFGALGVILFLAAIYSASVISQYYCLKRRDL